LFFFATAEALSYPLLVSLVSRGVHSLIAALLLTRQDPVIGIPTKAV
jgi:hypothetical protein